MNSELKYLSNLSTIPNATKFITMDTRPLMLTKFMMLISSTKTVTTNLLNEKM